MVKVIGILDYDLIKTFFSNLDALDVKLSTLQRTRVYEQSFEDGTSDLTAYNCTQEVQTSEVFAGQYALKVTVSSGQSGYVETPRIDISPYQMINFSLVHKENEYVQSIKLVVIWRRSAGGEVERYETTLTPSSEWKPEDVTLMSPKNTATMTIRFEITAKSGGNAVVYLDDIFMDRIGILLRQDSEGYVLVKDESILSRLDVELSTIASESTLSAVLSKLNDVIRARIDDSIIAVPVDVQRRYKHSISIWAGTFSASGTTPSVETEAIVAVVIAKVTAANGTMNVYVEGYVDATGDWITIGSITGITSTGVFASETIFPLVFRLVRVRYEVAGSFTVHFALQGVT